MLAEHFLHQYAEKYKRPELKFAQSAYDQMLNYNWRGNVRELEHSVERAGLLSRNGEIDYLDIPKDGASVNFNVQQHFTAVASAAKDYTPEPSMIKVHRREPDVEANEDASESVYEKFGRSLVDQLPEPQEGVEQKDVFNEIESGVVVAALKRTKGNKQAAANLLGLYRPRLYGMIKRHNLEGKI